MKFKFVTLNIWLGGLLMDDAIRYLREQDADVVALQEVYNGNDPALEKRYRTIWELQRSLNYPYVDFKADFRDIDDIDGRAQRGNAVLSKFPIVESNSVFFSLPYSDSHYHDVAGNYHNCPRSLQHVVCDTDAGKLNVYNFQGVWDLDGDNYSDLRKSMSETIIRQTRDKSGVILAGDTNAKPTNKAIIDIGTHLHSVFGETLRSTFNMRRKDNLGYATAAVDMVFTSPDIIVVDSRCHDVDISDHLPLVVGLELKTMTALG